MIAGDYDKLSPKIVLVPGGIWFALVLWLTACHPAFLVDSSILMPPFVCSVCKGYILRRTCVRFVMTVSVKFSDMVYSFLQSGIPFFTVVLSQSVLLWCRCCSAGKMPSAIGRYFGVAVMLCYSRCVEFLLLHVLHEYLFSYKCCFFFFVRYTTYFGWSSLSNIQCKPNTIRLIVALAAAARRGRQGSKPLLVCSTPGQSQ